jgi:hypothetical protein
MRSVSRVVESWAVYVVLLASLVVVSDPRAWAQDVTPTPDPATSSAAAPAYGEKPKAEAEAAKAEQPAKPEQPADGRVHVTITLGGTLQDVEGNPNRWRQYVTPPSGPHISLLRVDQGLSKGGLLFGVEARDLPEPNARAVGYLYEVDEGVRLDSRYRRSQFYDEFFAGAAHETRTDWRTDARWRITPVDHLMASYTEVKLHADDDSFVDAKWGGTYTRELGAYDAHAALKLENFTFAPASANFPGQALTLDVGVGPSRDARTLWTGNVAFTKTSLDGVSGAPNETAVSLGACHQITDTLSLSGDLRYWKLTDSIAQTAYARAASLAAIEGDWVGLPRTVVRAGFESERVDYVNAPHTQVVQPTVNTALVSIRTRPRRDIRLEADYRRARLNHRPLAFTIGGIPTATDLYGQYDRLRLRGNWTPRFAPIGITAGFQQDKRANEDQDARSQLITRDISGWWNINRQVSATVSFLNQTAFIEAGASAVPFASDSRSWSVGANWRLSSRSNLSASYQRADAFGAVEVRQNIWSASLEHRWRAYAARLGLTLDDLDHYTSPLLGYDADLWYAEFSARLP